MPSSRPPTRLDLPLPSVPAERSGERLAARIREAGGLGFGQVVKLIEVHAADALELSVEGLAVQVIGFTTIRMFGMSLLTMGNFVPRSD